MVATMDIFLCIALASFVLVITVPMDAHAQYADVRCKCLCPKEENQTHSNVIIKTTTAELCTCLHVVQRPENYCLRCECKYETRNTLLIKVMVVFVLFGHSSLIVYAMIVTIRKRVRAAAPLSISADTDRAQPDEDYMPEHPSVRDRRPTAQSVSSVSGQFEKLERRMSSWQKKVEFQRENVYSKNTILN